MKTILAMTFVATLAAPAFAQQVMDGSDKAFDRPIAKEIADALTRITRDPYSAQIKSLRPSPADPKDICGEINLKNGFDAYTGFEPFIIYSGTLYLQASDQCR